MDLPWTHHRSSYRTSYHSSGHRRGTRWCRSDRWTWRCRGGCRCSSPCLSRSHWSGRCRQTSHQHWNIFKLKYFLLKYFSVWILYEDLFTKSWLESIFTFHILSILAASPVVHEHVWFPDIPGRNPDISEPVILRFVPSQVYICPLLSDATTFRYAH